MVNPAAEEFLRERYLGPREDWKALCERVATFLADDDDDRRKFFQMLYSCDALPNSPTLMNSGTELGYLSACNLVPVPDDLEGIMDAAKSSAMIQRNGGGVGFNFSELRPTNDRIRGTGGTSSGVISFMKLLDTVGQVIKQGGKRRSANLGLLRYDHPDILRWIHAKDKDGELTAFNISVAASDELFEKAERGENVVFINPRNGRPFPAYDPIAMANRDSIPARELLDRIAKSMWKSGEPGIIYWDTLQRGNTTPFLGDIQGLNPCGESPLYYWESCCLGSINLYNHLKQSGSGKRELDFERLAETTRTMVRLLNSVIDKNKYPLPHMEKAAKHTRKIGIGVMGLADIFGAMGIRYGSNESMALAGEVMAAVSKAAREESARLAEIHGPYPAWEKSNGQAPKLRNATLTSIAPTGSISFIAGVSSGIEPFFKIGYMMNREDRNPIFVVAKSFHDDLREAGLEDTLTEIIKHDYTPLQMVREGLLPESFAHYVTAGEVSPEEHVLMQAVFQEHVDLAISKTINLPNRATVDDVKKIIYLAHTRGCKGLTVFRNGCERESFLSEFKCPHCGSDNVQHTESCIRCLDCGMSLCAVG
ncbi:MAG: adenosylcobalamin-dependent ribonucleoside-diphosphate reductase [Candidatus Thorarchaeota archaeon]|nr:MAG: adenosylcobalamin-dependent ribonucleoside-diphosphate reductase [Candidatus Thorarchaeota archaeon]